MLVRTKGNPFDRNPGDIPILRFLIHSDSLSKEILSKDSEAYRLVRLNNFREIEVMSLPVTDDRVRNCLIDNGLILTEYYTYNGGVGLKGSDGSVHNVAYKAPDNLWENIAPDSTVTLADIFASNICDYIVVREGDPALEKKNIAANIVTAEQALDITRVLMASHGRYYISPRTFPVGEGFYYLYRFKKLYKSYQFAWTVAVHTHGKELSEAIYDQLDSLSRRLEFLCRAYDKIAVFSLKTVNWDIQHNQLYHLAYFVMLSTGVFDNLAHIIKEFYQLEIKGRMNISLRFPRGNRLPKFYQELQVKNASLYDFLSSESTQKQMDAFYPIRDSLQHRELFRVIQYSDATIHSKSLIELSEEAAKKLIEEPAASSCIISHRPFLDPLLFTIWAQGVLVNIVNTVLSAIDWNKICKTLQNDIQDKIRESNQRFEQGVGHLLGWPDEPWYF